VTVSPFDLELSIHAVHHHLRIARRSVSHVDGSPARILLCGEAAVILAAVIDGPFTLDDDNRKKLTCHLRPRDVASY